MVYAREIESREHEFGVRGIQHDSLMLYDRQTQSLWTQLGGEALRGPLAGTRLPKFPSLLTTWANWKSLHPDTTVFVKRQIYYRARFTAGEIADFARHPDGPLEDGDLIIGLLGETEAKAYPLKRLARSRLINDSFEDQTLLVYLSEDLTTARVLRRKSGGRVLTFRLNPDQGLIDEETGSQWSPLTGEAVSGALKGSVLEPLSFTYSRWASWKLYRPDTQLFGNQ